MKPDHAERYMSFIAHIKLRDWAAWVKKRNDEEAVNLVIDGIVAGLPSRLKKVVYEEYLFRDKRRSERRRACYLRMERRDYRTVLWGAKLLVVERWSTSNRLKNKNTPRW